MKKRAYSFHTVFLMAFAVLIVVVSGFMVLLIVGLQTRASYFDHIAFAHIPVIRSTEEALVALNDARNAIGVRLSGSYAADLDTVSRGESKFHAALLRYEMYTTAMSLGSETDAFQNAAGGIMFTEWKRQNLTGTFAVRKVSEPQVQSIAHLGTEFDAYAKKGQQIFILQRRKILAVEERDAKIIQTIDGDIANLMIGIQEDFTQVIGAADTLIDVTHTLIDSEVATRSASIRATTTYTVGYGVVSLILLALLGYVGMQRYFILPLSRVSAISRSYSTGDLSGRIAELGIVELDEIAHALNTTAQALGDEQKLLESRVAERTRSLGIASKEATDRMVQLQKEQQSAVDAKTAMLNLLEDSRELEEQITAERDRLNTIITTMSEGLFVVDMEYRVILANASAETLFGMQTGASMGKKLNDITTVYKGDQKLAVEDRPLWRALHENKTFSYGLNDEHYIESTGRKIPVAITCTPLVHNGAVIGGLVTFHDISRDKKTKETIEKEVVMRTSQLQSEQARLLASINSLTMGCVLIDKAGGILLLNRPMQGILGAHEGVWSLDGINSLFSGIVTIKDKLFQCMTDGNPMRDRAIEWSNRILNILYVPVTVQHQTTEVIGALLLIDDITERKVMERSKDEFFSIASHELRTPLTAIRGNTSMIQEFYGDKLTDPDLKEMISDIHASSIRLIDIVNDFLNVSRLEQGKIDFKKTDVDMKDLAIESVAEFEGSALEKHVVVRFEDTGDVPKVLADRDRTKQVILNLLGNALKFTQSGEVKLRLSQEEKMLRCSVIDNGRGIPVENQKLLFRKFQQAGKSLFTRDTTGGTGLGLYISRLIIEGMLGKIWLEKSEEGKGSEFCFSLPIAS